MKIVFYILAFLILTTVCMAEDSSPNSQIIKAITNYYEEEGQTEEAKQYLDEVGEFGDVRLNPISEFGFSRTSPKFKTNLLGGYDTNVLLIADPTLLPDLKTASWFTKPSVQILAPIGLRNFALEIASIYTHHFSKSAQAYDNVFASLGLDYGTKGITAYLSADATWYNLLGRMRILSVAENFGLRGIPLSGEEWSLAYDLAFRYAKYPFPINSNPSYNADGPLVSPSLTLNHPLLSFKLTESVIATKQWAKGCNMRMQSIEGRLGILKELLSKRLDAETNFSAIRTMYPGSYPVRLDQSMSSEIAMTLHIPEIGTKLNASGSYWRTYSTIFAANYFKYVFTLGISYDAL